MSVLKNSEGKEFDYKPPKAIPGQMVWVHNYKKKRKVDGRMVDAEVWEWATVGNVQTRYTEDEKGVFIAKHSYDVCLTRKGGRRGLSTLGLYLSEQGIQLQNEY